jgi:hypothetical protein
MGYLLDGGPEFVAYEVIGGSVNRHNGMSVVVRHREAAYVDQ